MTTLSVLLFKLSASISLISTALAAPAVYDIQPRFPDQASVRSFIIEQAKLNDVSVILALHVAQRESMFEPHRIGDTDKICPKGPNKGKPMRSRGVWQINDCAWPNIDDETAFDIVSSTAWAMPKLKETPQIWSTYRFCDKWYEDCPL